MKWILFLFILFGTESCIMLHTSSSGLQQNDENAYSANSVCIYNDSVDNIIKHSSTVKMYQMVGFVRDSGEVAFNDSLFNYPIDTVIGKLDKKEKILLDFVISDKKQYRKDYDPIRQPFHPNFALEFIKRKQRAYYFVSFGTGEVAIVDTSGNFKFYLMKDSKLMKRWYDHVMYVTKDKKK